MFGRSKKDKDPQVFSPGQVPAPPAHETQQGGLNFVVQSASGEMTPQMQEKMNQMLGRLGAAMPGLEKQIETALSQAQAGGHGPMIITSGSLLNIGGGPQAWKLPHECPNCGAPVDQAAEASTQHPICHMCHEPLPIEAPQ